MPDRRDDAGEIETRRVADMFIDQRYQRTVRQAKVERIVREFDPRLVGTPVVSERRGGKLAVIIGQHRVLAMRERGVRSWAVLVLRGLSRADEAALFVGEAVGTTPLTRYDQHKAALVSGEPPARAIEAVATGLGFRIRGGGKNDGYLTCVASVYGVYHRHGGDALAQVLATIAEAWGTDESHARTGHMITGLAGFYARHGGDPKFDRAGFVNKLAGTLPNMITNRAAEAVRMAGGNAELTLYRELLKLYNSGRRNRIGGVE